MPVTSGQGQARVPAEGTVSTRTISWCGVAVAACTRARIPSRRSREESTAARTPTALLQHLVEREPGLGADERAALGGEARQHDVHAGRELLERQDVPLRDRERLAHGHRPREFEAPAELVEEVVVGQVQVREVVQAALQEQERG